MANESGTSAAPTQKAAEKKSGNVGESQAVKMLLKREAESGKAVASAAPVEPAEAPKPEPKETTIPAVPSGGAPEAPQPQGTEPKPEPEKASAEGEEPDQVLSQLSQEQKDRIQKRIDKEVSKRKALEDDLSRLKTLVNATSQQAQPAPQVAPTPENPLANVFEPNALASEEKTAREAKYWAQEQLDREDLGEGIKVGERTYTKADLKAVVRNADRLLTEHIPERIRFLNQRATVDRQTMETFPWVTDRESPEFQAFQGFMRDPRISALPNASWVAAVLVEGNKVAQSRGKPIKEPEKPAEAPKQKAPASQLGSGSPFVPSREPDVSKAAKALDAELAKLKGKKGVSGRDVEAYLLKQEQLRTR